MRGLYGKVLPEVFRTDRATKERGLCDKNRRQFVTVQTEQTRLIRDLLHGFVGLQFVVTLYKRPKNAFAAKTFSRIYLGHLFVQDSKTHSGSDFRRHLYGVANLLRSDTKKNLTQFIIFT